VLPVSGAGQRERAVDRDFWLERWAQDQIGFHQSCVNPLLVSHWSELGVPADAGVFVPLCGKSLDMRYLESLGHPVSGVELSEKAVAAYFAEGGETPERIAGDYMVRFLVRYRGPRTTVFCGDFLDISAPDIRGVAGVYDRGALVALPPRQRAYYADHLQRIVPERTAMLLLTLEYDQSLVSGPPFSVSMEEVEALYGSRCSIIRLSCTEASGIPPRFAERGVERVTECAYRLVKNH